MSLVRSAQQMATPNQGQALRAKSVQHWMTCVHDLRAGTRVAEATIHRSESIWFPMKR